MIGYVEVMVSAPTTSPKRALRYRNHADLSILNISFHDHPEIVDERTRGASSREQIYSAIGVLVDENVMESTRHVWFPDTGGFTHGRGVG